MKKNSTYYVKKLFKIIQILKTLYNVVLDVELKVNRTEEGRPY